LSGLSDQQLAGQRVIYSYPGLTPPPALLHDIRAGLVGGVIFFSANISGTDQIHSVIQQLDRAAAQSPVKAPLLLMTDQEGGEVRRMPGAPALSEKRVGAAPNGPLLATQAGADAGENLSGAGMNLNLAPVLDVYRTPGDFDDQYQRSFSSDPQLAGRLGKNFITAMQRTEVAATAKHFPGLGGAAANQNTDLAPVTLNVSLHALRTVDEVPFRSAIAAHVKLIMTSWAVYPALDPKHPAGLSRRIVQGELRGRLGFKGVTITDALGAVALRAYGTGARRAVLAAQAGMDLILASTASGSLMDFADDAVNGMATALRSGTLDRNAFLAADLRILALRTSIAQDS
jgi:beta-N-acetylhexosaminidase